MGVYECSYISAPTTDVSDSVASFYDSRLDDIAVSPCFVFDSRDSL